MDTQTQLQLAKEAGRITLPMATYQTWLQEYKYHLGMVQRPLPFFQFKMKFETLDGMFTKDPEGQDPLLDGSIQRLCNELGY